MRNYVRKALEQRRKEGETARLIYELRQLAIRHWFFYALSESNQSITKYSDLKRFLPKNEKILAMLMVHRPDGSIDENELNKRIRWVVNIETRVDWLRSNKTLATPIPLYGEDATLVYYRMCPTCEAIVEDHHDSVECLWPFVCPSCWKEELEAKGRLGDTYYAKGTGKYDEMVRYLNSVIDFDKKYHARIEFFGWKFYPYRVVCDVRLWFKKQLYNIRRTLNDSARNKV